MKTTSAPEALPDYVAALYADMSDEGRRAFLETVRTMADAGRAQRRASVPAKVTRRTERDGAEPYPNWFKRNAERQADRARAAAHFPNRRG